MAMERSTWALYRALADHYRLRRDAEQQENSFLWARLISLIEVVIENNHGDGSGENAMRIAADTTLEELQERLDGRP
jgi:hypothetical protein